MSASALVLLLKSIDLLMLSITVAPAVVDTFATITKSVRIMVAENRGPTMEEWDKLDTLRDAVHKAIQEA